MRKRTRAQFVRSSPSSGKLLFIKAPYPHNGQIIHIVIDSKEVQTKLVDGEVSLGKVLKDRQEVDVSFDEQQI